jgi:ribosomal protein L37AE/L43A
MDRRCATIQHSDGDGWVGGKGVSLPTCHTHSKEISALWAARVTSSALRAHTHEKKKKNLSSCDTISCKRESRAAEGIWRDLRCGFDVIAASLHREPKFVVTPFEYEQAIERRLSI